jgi:hypothetical protein
MEAAMKNVRASSSVPSESRALSIFDGSGVTPWMPPVENLPTTGSLGGTGALGASSGVSGSSAFATSTGSNLSIMPLAQQGVFNLDWVTISSNRALISSQRFVERDKFAIAINCLKNIEELLEIASAALSSLTPTGTVARPWKPVGAPVQPIYWGSPNITVEGPAAQQIFDAVQAFYLSNNKQRDHRIADRITTLYRDALAEGEHIYQASLNQFTEFFLSNKDLGFPRITLTPDETLRARWIQGKDNFVAIEFTGEPDAKLVAEIPGLVPPMHFSRQPLENVLAVAKAMGGSFT